MESVKTFGKDFSAEKIEQLAVNVIRGLAMDAVQKANSGHPGMPMGAADIAYVLWTKFLKHNPTDTQWPDRDRFILSAGHGSMLLYSLLYLTGYKLTLDDLKNFRQWESLTPGHPEHGVTDGVEMTTGPLGQGFSTGVGMAIAEKRLAEMFNGADFKPVDHFIYAIVSDGDLMEGVSNEAASIAGHLKLGKIVYLYDSNQISIEGGTNLTFSENVGERFKALGWHIQEVDGHDRKKIENAIKIAREAIDKPSLIIAKTHIAFGSPNKHDSESSHGAPLGEDEIVKTKTALGLPPDEKFFVPEIVLEHYRKTVIQFAKAEENWNAALQKWKKDNPEKAQTWDKVMSGNVPADILEKLPKFKAGEKVATRKASGMALQALAANLPGLVGGSADLGPSNNTTIEKSASVCSTNFCGCNIHFGVREHAMGSILNGLALHGGVIPYGGTFLIFSDYMRPPIRLAALMKQRVIYVFTHDSIFVGEDGPTHQPIEQTQTLRQIPDMRVFRPADATETVLAWVEAINRKDGPTALLLTRQALPTFDRNEFASVDGLKKGAYVLMREKTSPAKIIIIATGSEVSIAVEAAKNMEKEGVSVRVVSMPSMELFEAQDEKYKDEVLPPAVKIRVSVEAGITPCWAKYVGPFGKSIGIDRFGASAPEKALAEKFGFNAKNVYDTAKRAIAEFPEKAAQYKSELEKSLGK